MSTLLRPPSRIEPLTFPVFAMFWFADPGDGTSVVAYCGGGGSAKTGVTNGIVVEMSLGPRALSREARANAAAAEEDVVMDETRRIHISTDEMVGVALRIYQDPTCGEIWMVVAMGKQVNRYHLPSGELVGTLRVTEAVNAITVNAMGDKIAIGCDSGLVLVYAINQEEWELPITQEGAAEATEKEAKPLYICNRHQKTVCALDFSVQGNRLITSAKDGTGLIWEDGRLLAGFQCSIRAENEPPPKKPVQVLVRGCAFCDLHGRVAIAVASGRKGKAFLSRWEEQSSPPDKPDANVDQALFACTARINCSPNPISAMSLSQDGSLLALGGVDGTIQLVDVMTLKTVKSFPQVHELPVMCIAARPFALPLLGEDEHGVEIHARSASADSRLACLTMQRRAKKKIDHSTSSRRRRTLTITGCVTTINRILYTVFLVYALAPVFQEARGKCGSHSWGPLLQKCLLEEFLLAPPHRPGILVPPY